MKLSSQKLTINALSAVLQVLFTALLFFFLYKYLLNTIGVEQLGVWSLILSFSSIANLANMGLTSGLVKFVAEYILDEDKSKLGKLIFTSVISMSILFCAISIVIFFGAQFFLKFLIDEKFLDIALQILPYSLGSLSINAIGGVFTSVLEGYQKNYIRNFIYIGSGIIMFGITVLLTPIFNLKGVAIAQLAQAISVLILAFCFIIKIDHNNRIKYWKWNLQSFKELFSYGYKFQIVSICQLLYEPTTKFLLSKYGGLSFLGHYEMATRAVGQFRALLVNANQVVIPVVAEKAMGESHEKLILFYTKMNRVMHLFTFPLSTLLVLVTPLISTVWIGKYEPEFVWSVYILTISYIVNIMSGPSYFSCLGEGNLNILILSHLGMAIINIVLGYILGVEYGGVGIVAAWGVSIIIGSLITFFLYQKKKQFKFRDIFTSFEFWTTIISAIFILGGILLFNSDSIYLKTIVIVITFLLVNGWFMKKNNLMTKLSELKK
ncbi:O-antigen/teichoic acid export membrane protein [Epilithonimonas hungarica]|uniref:oligosaccharide flippase family protein n=1 Tax=Epilithonimonas hungarica TaxID=454006 RepID=UPI00277D685F|nr:oligosaccharide flippase family protein [Epilithonimonas hungarica]MDP9954607.1 O-antigen/teichoic acid export membrane protein [Epilithonimonas hungarica]